MTKVSSAPRRAKPGALNLPALAAMGGSMVSVQLGASLAEGLFPAVGAQGATALRVGLAAVILLLAFRPWRRRPPRGAWPALLGYGLSLGAMNLLFYSALQTVPLGVAVALEFVGPLTVAVLGSRRRLDFACVALAAGGIVALSPLGGQLHAPPLTGVALALGAGACWGLYIVFGERAGSAHGAQATAIGMTVAALLVVPVGVAAAGAALLNPAIWAPALGVAMLSSVAPYTLEMFALTRIPVRVFGTLMSLEPAVAALAGLVVLHERLGLRACAAIGAIMVASLITTLSLRPDAARNPALVGAD